MSLIDFGIQKIESVTEILKKYCSKIHWIGMSKMLNSMQVMQKEHKKKLIQLRQQGNLETLFVEKAEFDKAGEDFFPDVNFFCEMDLIDFLSMLIKQQEEYINFFEYLVLHSAHETSKHLFQTLAEDARKQRIWALDRYELEILTL